MTTSSDRLNKLGGINAPERTVTMEEFKARIARARVTKRDEGIGRFKLGERVKWKGNAGKRVHQGTIIEVVKRGMYPGRQHKTLTLHGYYRETESYVVESCGRQYWPRVGNLRRVET